MHIAMDFTVVGYRGYLMNEKGAIQYLREFRDKIDQYLFLGYSWPYWNNPEFREIYIYEEIEYYTQGMMFGCDCEQELVDAWCKMAVYALKKKYGEANWREHAPKELLDYYDEMQKRQSESDESDGDGSDEGEPGGDGSSDSSPSTPPGNQNHDGYVY